MTIVDKIIQRYHLLPHPEGGWYVQTYKSSEEITANALPERFGDKRPFSTAIYFLLEQGNFSAFHHIKSDECWHFYEGDPLEIFVLQQNGELNTILLGKDFEKGQQFQYVVPANCWFASRPAQDSSYCFVGCTVSPGFDFADFELATIDSLIATYPKHQKVISSLCR
jgi:uncharacterized protein